MSLPNDHLSAAVTRSLENYFKQLDGESPHQLYDLVLQQVEKPLLEMALQQCNNNQSRTAEILGLSRGTLRKKLKQYDLIQHP